MGEEVGWERIGADSIKHFFRELLLLRQRRALVVVAEKEGTIG